MWVGLLMLLVIVCLLLWQFIRIINDETRIYTYKVGFKGEGYVAYDKWVDAKGHSPKKALESLGVEDPRLVTTLHDARYTVLVGDTLVGYYK